MTWYEMPTVWQDSIPNPSVPGALEIALYKYKCNGGEASKAEWNYHHPSYCLVKPLYPYKNLKITLILSLTCYENGNICSL